MPVEYQIILWYWGISLVVTAVLTVMGVSIRAGMWSFIYATVSIGLTIALVVVGAEGQDMPWQLQAYIGWALFVWIMNAVAAAQEQVTKYTPGLFVTVCIIGALQVWLLVAGATQLS